MPLLTFDGAKKHAPEIDRWLDSRPEELGALARRWFSVMRECGDDVRELLHDGFPYVCVEGAPFAYVNTFTAHANVGFVYGTSLPDPAGLLVGKGRWGRHVKLRPGADRDAAAIGELIRAAHADIRSKLRSGRQVP